jgi:hypothetical protein
VQREVRAVAEVTERKVRVEVRGQVLEVKAKPFSGTRRKPTPVDTRVLGIDLQLFADTEGEAR